MLNAIKTFFEEHITPGRSDSQQDEEHRLQVAVAAVLAEVVRMDEQIAEGERAQVLASIAEKFDLDAEEAEAVTTLAEEEAKAATDFYQFTSQIKRAFSPEQKVKLIEHMWRVAYADGTLHKYEDHLIRKIAELIYVPHKELIAAKLRVQPDG
ncbi:MAG: TerB family tellurite resistance protein [Gammaproteobacteria bacterium]